jgi:hypothetical protein
MVSRPLSLVLAKRFRLFGERVAAHAAFLAQAFAPNMARMCKWEPLAGSSGVAAPGSKNRDTKSQSFPGADATSGKYPVHLS